MNRNETLIDLRFKAKLSRKDAAKGLKMPAWLLKRYEEGYTQINNKRAKQFAEFYKVEPKVFTNDRLLYPGQIETTPYAEPKPPSTFPEKAAAFLSNKKAFIGVAAATAVMLSALGVSTYYNIDINETPKNYYSSTVRELQDDVLENGTPNAAAPLYFAMTMLSTFTEIRTDYDENTYFSVMVPDNQNFYSVAIFLYRRPYVDTEGVHWQYEDGTPMTERFWICTMSDQYPLFGYTNPERPTVDLANLASGKYIDGELSFNEYALTEVQQGQASEMLPVVLSSSEEYFATLSGEGGITEYIEAVRSESSFYTAIKDFTLFSTFILSCLNLFLVPALIYMGVCAFKKKKPEEETPDKKKGSTEDWFISRKEKLPRNLPDFLFLKEGYAKVVALGILLVGALAILFAFLAGLVGEGTIMGADVMSLWNSSKPFMYVAIFTVFFIKVDVILSRKNALFSIFLTFYLGACFYILEALLFRFFSTYGLFGTAMAAILPSNIFLGMTAILTYGFFLTYFPKFADKKWKLIIFRLGSLLPIAYVVTSFVIPFVELRAATSGNPWTVSPYVEFLFQTRSLEMIVFGVVSISFTALYRYVARKKYGIKKGDIRMTGTVYQTSKNIVLVVLLLIIGILGFGGTGIPHITDFLNLTSDRYLLALIPFFLLYRPRIPKGNVVQDMAFNITYIAFYMGPYLAAGIMILAMG